MITRIERDIFFVAGVHFDDQYHINSYELVLSMLVETDVSKEQVVALDRLDFLIKNIITNAVFINEDKEDCIEKYRNAGLKVATLPGEPYDQIVGMVLLLKLNSIMENRIKITDITINSLLSDGLRYPIVSESAENADIMLGHNWWHSNDTEITNDDISVEPKNNVVKLFDDTVWADLNLSWKDKAKTT